MRQPALLSWRLARLIGYDAPRNRLYIVTGGKDVNMKESYLSEIDPDTLQHYGDIKFDSNHTEAMAVDKMARTSLST